METRNDKYRLVDDPKEPGVQIWAAARGGRRQGQQEAATD